MTHYRITDVIQRFLAGGYGAERNELMHDFDQEFKHNRALRMFLAQVCDESYKAGQQPLVAMGQAMVYGLVLGILLEQDSNRKRLIV